MEIRYLIDECGCIKPMADDVLWRYLVLLADAYRLNMPIALDPVYDRDRIISLVDEAMEELNERGRNDLRARYGLPDGEGSTYKEIAQKYNITPESVRTLVFNNLSKIRAFMIRNGEKILVQNDYYSCRRKFVDILEEDLRNYLILGESRIIGKILDRYKGRLKLTVKDPETVYYNSSMFPKNTDDPLAGNSLFRHINIYGKLGKKYRTIADIINKDDETLENLYCINLQDMKLIRQIKDCFSNPDNLLNGREIFNTSEFTLEYEEEKYTGNTNKLRLIVEKILELIGSKEKLLLDTFVSNEQKLQALYMGIVTVKDYLDNKYEICQKARSYKANSGDRDHSADRSSYLYSDVVVIGAVSGKNANTNKDKFERTILNKEEAENIEELAAKALGEERRSISKPARFMLYETFIMADLKKHAQSANRITDIALGEIGEKYEVDILCTERINELVKECGLERTDDEAVRICEIEAILRTVLSIDAREMRLIYLDRSYHFSLKEIEAIQSFIDNWASEKGKNLTSTYKLDEAIIRLAEIKRRKGEVTPEDIEKIISEYGFTKTKIMEMKSIAKWERII